MDTIFTNDVSFISPRNYEENTSLFNVWKRIKLTDWSAVWSPPVPELPSVIEDYVSELKEKLEEIHQFARVRMRVASDRMKRRYDIDTSRAVFDVGDAVWLYNPKRRKGESPKLSCDWKGLCLVLKRINELLYRVRKSANAKPRVVHRNRSWRYVEDTIAN